LWTSLDEHTQTAGKEWFWNNDLVAAAENQMIYDLALNGPISDIVSLRHRSQTQLIQWETGSSPTGVYSPQVYNGLETAYTWLGGDYSKNYREFTKVSLADFSALSGRYHTLTDGRSDEVIRLLHAAHVDESMDMLTYGMILYGNIDGYISNQSGGINPNSDLIDAQIGQGNQLLSKGKLTGSLNKLTQAERIVINDLLGAGKNVQIIPRSNVQNAKTPDFFVDGIKTELKTLYGTSLNTPVTRIQDGFKQGASAVILDGRSSGLTAEQAQAAIIRANGVYKGDMPGKVEIWTNSGTVYGGRK
jgi:hypothetical protein